MNCSEQKGKQNEFILQTPFWFCCCWKAETGCPQPKGINFCLTIFHIIFWIALGDFGFFFLSQSCLGQYWFWVCVGFFPLQKKFHWEVFILAASTSWNTSSIQMFERHLVKLSRYCQDENSLLTCFGLFHNY